MKECFHFGEVTEVEVDCYRGRGSISSLEADAGKSGFLLPLVHQKRKTRFEL
jgi:hypothetical protein